MRHILKLTVQSTYANCLFLILLLFASCNKTKAPITKRPIAVKTARVEKRDIPLFIDVTGHIESIASIDIKPQVEGQLLEAYFEEGSFVKKGDLLYLIDPRPFEAKFKEAKATLEENKATLALAEDKVRRYRPLVEEEYYSIVDYEQLVTTASANRASTEQSKANLEFAALQLEYCSITSPVDGVAGSFKVDPGNLVFANSTQTLVSLQQLKPIYITFSLPENQLHRLFTARKKGAVEVDLPSPQDPSQRLSGTLYMIDNQVDRSTGMIQAKALFDNKDTLLWPGEFIEARLVFEIKKDAIVIPYQSLLFTSKGPAVFVLAPNNSVEMRTCQLGSRVGDEIIVEKGVSSDEIVVTEGQFNLSPGSQVTVVPSSTSTKGKP